MLALFVAIIVWGIVAFIATDDYGRTHERRALWFLVFLGMLLSGIGLWRLDISHIFEVSVHDWLLLGFFLVFLFYLRLKTRLSRSQPGVEEQSPSLMDIKFNSISNQSLVWLFRVVRAIMWGVAVAVLIVQFLDGNGASF
jgi:Ca2+/Na+ antiporter